MGNEKLKQDWFSDKEKLIVIFFPSNIPIQILWGSTKFYEGGKEAWKQYYQLVLYGYVFYNVVLLTYLLVYRFTG